MRGGPRDFVYSKLMCWVAVDRAIRLADLLQALARQPPCKGSATGRVTSVSSRRARPPTRCGGLVVRGPDDFVALMSQYEHREVAEWTCTAWDGSDWTPCDREDARSLYAQPDGTLWSGTALSKGTLPGLTSLGLNESVSGLWGSLTGGMWAVGHRGNAGVGFTPISFCWDGTAWTEHALPGPELPGPVWGNGEHVWAPGERGSIRRWDGERWVREETPTWVGLSAIHGADGVVWAVGDAGIVLRKEL